MEFLLFPSSYHFLTQKPKQKRHLKHLIDHHHLLPWEKRRRRIHQLSKGKTHLLVSFNHSKKLTMEFFIKAKAVRLHSHLDKYLYAEEDEEKVRQSRQGSSQNVKWVVELIQGHNHVIRLKSCYGRYLTATDVNFLTGLTGKKVIQTSPTTNLDSSFINWEPIRDRFQVKLRCFGGKYLRANGGSKPWRNSITHDIPNRTLTQDWILWDVDIVDIAQNVSSLPNSLSIASSDDSSPRFSTSSSIQSSPRLSTTSSSVAPLQSSSRLSSSPSELGIGLFVNAKTIRLKSQHGKYLIAEEDSESVSQDDMSGRASRESRWTVELVQGGRFLRLKSCYGKYLTASNSRFHTGLIGNKVLQTSLSRLEDSSIDWQAITNVGFQQKQIKLMTRDGNFLRANKGFPHKNSVTHDIPKLKKTLDWILWDVEIIEMEAKSVEKFEVLDSVSDHIRESHVRQYESKNSSSVSDFIDEVEIHVEYETKHSISGSDCIDEVEIESVGTNSEDFDSRSDDHPLPPSEPSSPVKIPKPSKLESSASFGRKIYYQIADDEENGDERWYSFVFKGNTVKELSEKLVEETGLQNIKVCCRSEIDDQLYPLRVHLPPNNSTMHVIVVQASSYKVKNSFAKRNLR